ncbi:hypothetical protein ACFXEL_11755 [Streptomyces sp. NPDC059382]|uniref:hypothetical protein n=1 Tax=Streptomyces sp. NPDC059382 TaxID=3346816 RepID=UPI0036C0FBBD
MAGRQATARRPRASGGSDLTGREIVIESGQCTGRHCHDVPLMVVVTSGTLTRILDDGSVATHPAGATFVEPPGR